MWGWISQKTWGIETQYYSTPIGGAPGYRPSVSLRGLVLRAVPLVQTQGPRPLSPASQQGAPGPPASPFLQLESPLPHWKPPQAAVPQPAFREILGPYPASALLRVPRAPPSRSPPFSRRRRPVAGPHSPSPRRPGCSPTPALFPARTRELPQRPAE